MCIDPREGGDPEPAGWQPARGPGDGGGLFPQPGPPAQPQEEDLGGLRTRPDGERQQGGLLQGLLSTIWYFQLFLNLGTSLLLCLLLNGILAHFEGKTTVYKLLPFRGFFKYSKVVINSQLKKLH